MEAFQEEEPQSLQLPPWQPWPLMVFILVSTEVANAKAQPVPVKESPKDLVKARRLEMGWAESMPVMLAAVRGARFLQISKVGEVVRLES